VIVDAFVARIEKFGLSRDDLDLVSWWGGGLEIN
jgi:hypothetical protein